jgi:DNA-binding XRE family transcriptional regulator
MQPGSTNKTIGTISKAQLAELFDISRTTLSKLLNDTYYDELKPVGYRKTAKCLNPKVVRKIFELHGKPLSPEELGS